jgi:hypothetical protein
MTGRPDPPSVPSDDGALVDGFHRATIETMQRALDVMRERRDVVDREIARFEMALAALNGDPRVRAQRRKGAQDAPTRRTAILAALASFKAPVSSETLLDHSDLVHYSRNTLRRTLSELHAAGHVTAVERTPKGFIWAPLT